MKTLKDYDKDETPPESVHRYVLYECRRWNLVWVGKKKVAPLEPDEVEMLLGFPRDHTRGISRTDRYDTGKFIPDSESGFPPVSFEIDFPMASMSSRSSGIVGAEIALSRVGIPMKNVVSVEISDVSRNVVRCWWEQTNQRGNLYHLADVQDISSIGGFDPVIGGSPCNNLAGSNRHHQDGLQDVSSGTGTYGGFLTVSPGVDNS